MTGHPSKDLYCYKPSKEEIELALRLGGHERWCWQFQMPLHVHHSDDDQIPIRTYIGPFGLPEYDAIPGSLMLPAYWHPAMYGFLRALFFDEAAARNIQLPKTKQNLEPDALVEALLFLWSLSSEDRPPNPSL